MAKCIIDSTVFEGLANAIRKVNGETRTYTPFEMGEAVTNIMESAVYILVDENGNEYPAIYVDSEVYPTATENDIRIGTTAITNDGFVEGAKEIPSYQTVQGRITVKPGATLDIPMYSDKCQYTKLQCIICAYSSSVSASVSALMVVIDDKVYAVGSAEALAEVSVDITNQSIKLGLANDSENSVLIRYMTIKEEE